MIAIVVPEGVRLTEPQRRLLDEVERYGKVGVTGSRQVSAHVLQSKGVNIEIVAETHTGKPWVAYTVGEPWHWVVRAC